MLWSAFQDTQRHFVQEAKNTVKAEEGFDIKSNIKSSSKMVSFESLPEHSKTGPVTDVSRERVPKGALEKGPCRLRSGA